MNRRNFLLQCGTGLGAASGFVTNLASFNAFAADTDDYKALVCVFLSGAMDSHDAVIPYDQPSYDAYEAIRGKLISDLDNSSEGYSSRRRDALLELVGSGGTVDGRSFAFPEEYRPLQELYNQGDLAVVGNVGPLLEPTTRTTFYNGAANLPPRLFSHNDQQSVWMASAPEGAIAGWGGRFADLAYAAGANENATFTSVSARGSTPFLTGERIQPFQISPTGALSVNSLDASDLLGSTTFARNYEAVLRNTGGNPGNLFGSDVSSIFNSSLEANAFLAAEFAKAGDPSTAFPDSSLGSQLQVVSRVIARNVSFGVRRQIFFVGIGGFDTHANQATELPGLQAEIASSMRAFHDSMVELDLADKVTTFTGSDFGRTLSRNGSGTDHGWGSHHIVMGGAVNGGQILGNIPPPEFDHEYDVGRGRLIPQISVDQYAAALGKWFGLSSSELLDALPGFINFDASALDNLFT